jgi:hypothetical protein
MRPAKIRNQSSRIASFRRGTESATDSRQQIAPQDAHSQTRNRGGKTDLVPRESVQETQSLGKSAITTLPKY